MFIPGILIAILTFPGIIVHELGHLLFCKLTKTRVHKYCLFRFGNPAGYVIHDENASLLANFLITFGPLFLNSFMAIFLAIIFKIIPIFTGELSWISFWLPLSIGMHALPSDQDGSNLANLARQKSKEGNRLAVLFIPFGVLVQIFHFLKIIWIDLIYAVILISLATGTLNIPASSTASNMLKIEFFQDGQHVVGGPIIFDTNKISFILPDECNRYSCAASIPRDRIVPRPVHTVYFYGNDGCRKWDVPDNSINPIFGILSLHWENSTVSEESDCMLAFIEARMNTVQDTNSPLTESQSAVKRPELSNEVPIIDNLRKSNQGNEVTSPELIVVEPIDPLAEVNLQRGHFTGFIENVRVGDYVESGIVTDPWEVAKDENKEYEKEFGELLIQNGYLKAHEEHFYLFNDNNESIADIVSFIDVFDKNKFTQQVTDKIFRDIKKENLVKTPHSELIIIPTIGDNSFFVIGKAESNGKLYPAVYAISFYKQNYMAFLGIGIKEWQVESYSSKISNEKFINIARLLERRINSAIQKE